MAWDTFTRNPELKVMKWGWILVTLYGGPVMACAYVLSRQEPASERHEDFIHPLWKQAFGSTIHCMAGDWWARLEAVRTKAIRLNKTQLALGYRVWIAANDRGRLFEGIPLGTGCLEQLPDEISTAQRADAIRLIDVLWLVQNSAQVAAAFEVEHSTSIYSGIVRMLDLALSGSEFHAAAGLFLVAPVNREKDVRAQIARCGSGFKAIRAIARPLSTGAKRV